jgi:hypothetical protein
VTNLVCRDAQICSQVPGCHPTVVISIDVADAVPICADLQDLGKRQRDPGRDRATIFGGISEHCDGETHFGLGLRLFWRRNRGIQ